jgi:hypothetical protein
VGAKGDLAEQVFFFCRRGLGLPLSVIALEAVIGSGLRELANFVFHEICQLEKFGKAIAPI